MSQKLIQTQEQKLQQVQRLSQQQMLQVHLLEMPLTELEQNVNAELDDNPALETSSLDDVFEGGHVEGSDSAASYGDDAHSDDKDDSASDEFASQNEREERDDALTAALERIGEGNDEMPTAGYIGGSGADSADYEEMVYGDTTSFYDKLKEQMGETELSERDQEIMEYVIGSLDRHRRLTMCLRVDTWKAPIRLHPTATTHIRTIRTTRLLTNLLRRTSARNATML